MRKYLIISLFVISGFAHGQSMNILFTPGNCIYDTYFGTGTVYTAISKLSVGNLLSTSTTITAYVIDWYLNDTANGIEFTSGYGTDPAITYTHPFTGDASIPVEPGNWIPRIRYIITNGRKLYPIYRPWEDYCELDTFDITPYTCNNGGTGTYAHTVNFINTTQNPEYASRSIQFDLNSDGSANYFAVRFYGWLISDRITMYYCTLADPDGFLLEDIAIGQDIVGHDYRGTTYLPREYDAQVYRMVANLCDIIYATGDFIRIEITPSYVDPSNKNTNWRLEMKCLTTDCEAFTCFDLTSDMQTIDTSTCAISWDATNCRWINTYENFDYPAGYSTTQMWTYMELGNLQSYWNYDLSWNNPITGAFLRENVTGTTNIATSPPINYNCQNLDGIATLSKVTSGGNKYLIMEFTDIDDYNLFITDYNATINNSGWTNWSSDPTSILHYKYWSLSWRVIISSPPGTGQCGDAYTDYVYTMFHDADFTFDELNMEITIQFYQPPTNQYPDGSCETVHETIDQMITTMNNAWNAADFSGRATEVRSATSYTLMGYQAWAQTNAETSASPFQWLSLQAAVHDYMNTNLCDFSSPYWCLSDNGIYQQWAFYGQRTLNIITDINDPVGNWEIWDGIDHSTGCGLGGQYSTWPLIYKIMDNYEIPGWTVGTYNTGDQVINVGKAWESLTDSNTEEPVAESSNWHKISTY